MANIFYTLLLLSTFCFNLKVDEAVTQAGFDELENAETKSDAWSDRSTTTPHDKLKVLIENLTQDVKGVRIDLGLLNSYIVSRLDKVDKKLTDVRGLLKTHTDAHKEVSCPKIARINSQLKLPDIPAMSSIPVVCDDAHSTSDAADYYYAKCLKDGTWNFTDSCDLVRACQSGINSHKRTCYWIETTADTFHNMEQTCANKGGNLATIDSTKTSDFVKAFLNNQSISGKLWIGYEESKPTWNDGRTLIYCPNYLSGEPSNDNQRCTELWKTRGWQWNDEFCFLQREGLCQSYNLSASACQSGINTHKKTCYWIETAMDQFANMEKTCASKGGNLATIDSKVTSDFVIAFLNSKRLNRYASPWIGYKEPKDTWNDGSKFTHCNYAKGEPNGARDLCTEISSSLSWQWSDAACSSTKPGLCQAHT